jgi:hypothetical protein
MMTEQHVTRLLGSLSFIIIAVVLLGAEPLPQWPEYHLFADDRRILGIANMHNVLSNLGFLVVGAWGLVFMAGQAGLQTTGNLKNCYWVFFSGLILTGLGSAYFHLHPDNQTLVWDRLPMTIMFMGFFAAVIGELLGERTARVLLIPLLLAGMASVAWWAWTESMGVGDLRPYALVQFLPMLLVLLMLFLSQKPAHFTPYIAAMIMIYGLAKLCELYDHEIFTTLGWISGHALKHLFSAVASAAILMMLYRRKQEAERSDPTT